MRFALAAVLALAAVASAQRVVLHDRSNNVPSTWTPVGDALPADAVKFIVALKQQNLDKLESAFWRVSDPQSTMYQEFMTPAQIMEIVAPADETVAAVRAWLASAGVADADVTDYGDAFEVQTTVAVASELFQARFRRFRHASGAQLVRVNSQYSVPSEVAAHVDLVAGMSEFPVPRPKIRRDRSHLVQGVDDATIVPPTLVNLYGVPSSATAGNHSSGVIEFEQQYFSNKDLETFAQQVGLTIPEVPKTQIVGTNDPDSTGDEATLDIQYIASVGLGSQNWFWIEGGTTWLYGFAVHFLATQNVPDVISISYGWSEADQCEDGIGEQECQQLGVDSYGYVSRVNTEFMKIGLRGVSILVASGDSGANGRTDGGCTDPVLHPDFPAASPYVTSVGATQLVDEEVNLASPPPACQSGSGYTCASNGTEEAVSYKIAQFASGGGFSNVAPTPSYQSAAVSAYLASGVTLPPASYYNNSGRGYPDVAALGSSILIYEGGLEPVGGTSASSPIVAGVISLLNAASMAKNGKTLGFLNPFLYQMAAQAPAAFTDIVKGDNKCTEDGCASTCQGYYCAKGWDPVSGLGSPNYPAMLQYLQSSYAANQQ